MKKKFCFVFFTNAYYIRQSGKKKKKKYLFKLNLNPERNIGLDLFKLLSSSGYEIFKKSFVVLTVSRGQVVRKKRKERKKIRKSCNENKSKSDTIRFISI